MAHTANDCRLAEQLNLRGGIFGLNLDIRNGRMFVIFLSLVIVLLALALLAIFVHFISDLIRSWRFGTPINHKFLYGAAFIIVLILLSRYEMSNYISERTREFFYGKGILDGTETQALFWFVLIISFAYFNSAVRSLFFYPGKLLPAVIVIFGLFIGLHEYSKNQSLGIKCVNHATGDQLCRKYKKPDGDIEIVIKDTPVPGYWIDLGIPSREDLFRYDPELVAPKSRRIFLATQAECNGFQFFDSFGRPRVFYIKFDSGYELYDNPTRHPRTGQESHPITTKAVDEICLAVAEQEEAARQRRADEQAAASKATQEKELEQKRLEQAEAQRLRNEQLAAEKARRNEQLKIRKLIDQSKPGIPSEFCLNLLKNEKPLLVVIHSNHQCLTSVSSPYCADQMLARLGLQISAHYSSNEAGKPGCIAYQGGESTEIHEQTLQCLVRILGRDYYGTSRCSSYGYGGNAYEINHI